MVGGIQIGATECCMIMYGLQFGFALIPGTTTITREIIDLEKYCGIPFSFTVGNAICFSTFVLSIQYNFTNFALGISASKNKLYALICTLPFFQIPGMLYLASRYSQFWS